MAEFQQTLSKDTDIWILYIYLLSNIILLLKYFYSFTKTMPLQARRLCSHTRKWIGPKLASAHVCHCLWDEGHTYCKVMPGSQPWWTAAPFKVSDKVITCFIIDVFMLPNDPVSTLEAYLIGNTFLSPPKELVKLQPKQH